MTLNFNLEKTAPYCFASEIHCLQAELTSGFFSQTGYLFFAQYQPCRKIGHIVFSPF